MGQSLGGIRPHASEGFESFMGSAVKAG
jgi:hypothetical protein